MLVAGLGAGLGLGAASCERSTSQGLPDASAAGPVTLEALQDGEGAKPSGKRLMALPLGLHRLDSTSPAPTRAVIGIHGYESEGYEWVYPLKTLGKDGQARAYFYRWDFTQCPEPMADGLGKALDELLAAEPTIESVHLVAHSYGGVITALAVSRYQGRVPLVVDIVASPLAGHPGMPKQCNYAGPKAPPAEAPVELRQWRTQQKLDGAFEGIDPDPQIVDLPGKVTRLPESYRGHRLGHNWSISWVVDHLAGGAPP